MRGWILFLASTRLDCHCGAPRRWPMPPFPGLASQGAQEPHATLRTVRPVSWADRSARREGGGGSLPELTAGQTDGKHLLSDPSLYPMPWDVPPADAPRGAERALWVSPPTTTTHCEGDCAADVSGFWLLPWPRDFIFITARSAAELEWACSLPRPSPAPCPSAHPLAPSSRCRLYNCSAPRGRDPCPRAPPEPTGARSSAEFTCQSRGFRVSEAHGARARWVRGLKSSGGRGVLDGGDAGGEKPR